MTPESGTTPSGKDRPLRDDPYGLVPIFRERLVAIKPYETPRTSVGRYKHIGINQINRLAHVVIFETAKEGEDVDDILNRPKHLWVADPAQFERIAGYLHGYISDDLIDNGPFSEDFYIPNNFEHGFLIEDEKDRIFLFPDETKFHFHQGQFEEERWETLAQMYGIEAIVRFQGVSRNEEREDGIHTISTTEAVITHSFDFVGKEREERYLRSFAEKYEMTNVQFMRFIALVRGSTEHVQSLDYNHIAQEIVAEDK